MLTFQMIVFSSQRGGCSSSCGAPAGPTGAGRPCSTQSHEGVSIEEEGEEEEVGLIRESEARVTGQRSERHLHVLLHDDVETAH